MNTGWRQKGTSKTIAVERVKNYECGTATKGKGRVLENPKPAPLLFLFLPCFFRIETVDGRKRIARRNDTKT
ncbi:MAG: hypothetical protein LBH29_00985, partial [Elusimicrobiota bacterium]|nr:hypothetical protein [Elusimicrobiota bacterium]